MARADVGLSKSSGKGDPGLTKGGTTGGSTPSGGNGGYGGGGGGRSYSRGGGGGGTSKKEQKKLQATINNLGNIYGNKKNQLEKDTDASLNNINQKRSANDATLKQQNAQIMKSVEWQPQQQKEQSTLTSLRDRMGNSAYGSAIVDLQEGMHRVDDMADVQLINTWKQNSDNAYNNWYQADSELVGDYNEAIADAKSKMSDLMNQYQAALNNVNPLAASKKNITKASKQAAVLATAKKTQKAAAAAAKKNKAAQSLLSNKKSLQKIVNDLKKESKKSKSKNADYTISPFAGMGNGKSYTLKSAQKALTAATKKANANKAIAALNKANKALAKAKKASTSVGKKTEKITLPKVNMNPSSSFTKLTSKTLANSSAKNPLTAGYVRPGKGTDTVLGGARGNYNTADDANKAFAQDLRAYRPNGKIASTAKSNKKTSTAKSKKANTVNKVFGKNVKLSKKTSTAKPEKKTSTATAKKKTSTAKSNGKIGTFANVKQSKKTSTAKPSKKTSTAKSKKTSTAKNKRANTLNKVFGKNIKTSRR